MICAGSAETNIMPVVACIFLLIQARDGLSVETPAVCQHLGTDTEKNYLDPY